MLLHQREIQAGGVLTRGEETGKKVKDIRGRKGGKEEDEEGQRGSENENGERE